MYDLVNKVPHRLIEIVLAGVGNAKHYNKKQFMENTAILMYVYPLVVSVFFFNIYVVFD